MPIGTGPINMNAVYLEIFRVNPSGSHTLANLVTNSQLANRNAPYSLRSFAGYTHYPTITMPTPLAFLSTNDATISIDFQKSFSTTFVSEVYFTVNKNDGYVPQQQYLSLQGNELATGTTITVPRYTYGYNVTVTLDYCVNASYTSRTETIYIDPKAQQCTARGTYWYSYCNEYGEQINVYHNGSCGSYETVVGFCNPGDPSCFTGDTLITMADGSYKEVKYLQEGDEVASHYIDQLWQDDETYEYVTGWKADEVTVKPDVAKVVKARPGIVDGIYSINNGLLKASATHPHFVKDAEGYRFKKSKNLQVGDCLVKFDNSLHPITSIEYIEGPETVYEIDVEDNDLYTANGYITHNPFDKPTPIEP